MDANSDSVDGYVLPRFSIGVALEGEQTAEACPNSRVGPYEIVIRDGVPHARLILEADCTDRVEAMPVPYAVPTQLFPGTAPGGMTTPIVDYDVRSGSCIANLDPDTQPTITTPTDWCSPLGTLLIPGSQHLLP